MLYSRRIEKKLTSKNSNRENIYFRHIQHKHEKEVYNFCIYSMIKDIWLRKNNLIWNKYDIEDRLKIIFFTFVVSIRCSRVTTPVFQVTDSWEDWTEIMVFCIILVPCDTPTEIMVFCTILLPCDIPTTKRKKTEKYTDSFVCPRTYNHSFKILE